MGLDWVVSRWKAKAGEEARFAARYAAYETALGAGDDVERVELELAAVGVRAEEVLGAPRIGIDATATAWWREHVFAGGDEAAALLEVRGQFVLELAAGKPAWMEALPHALVSAIDFGGVGALADIDFLDGLGIDAWQDHTAAEALAFAAALEAELARVDLNAVDPMDVSLVTEAARWVRFWAERGFGFIAWS